MTGLATETITTANGRMSARQESFESFQRGQQDSTRPQQAQPSTGDGCSSSSSRSAAPGI
jgi:hypothetical protein